MFFNCYSHSITDTAIRKFLGVSVMRQTGSLNDVQYGAAMSSLSTVHYPSNNGIGTHVGIHQSVGIAGGYQMYEEQNSSIFNSP